MTLLDELGVTATAWAAPLPEGAGAGFAADELVTPASVMKIQVALAVARDIEGTRRVVLRSEGRTPGPTGIALMRDEVWMSVRDLLTLMLTISDNVATDELLGLVGIDRVNALTGGLGLARTHIDSDLRTTLDRMAAEAGFADYAAMARLEPAPPGLSETLAGTAALDPRRGSRTTARDTVELLRAVWWDPAGAPVREAMGNQLTRNRIASGFGAEVRVAAKSGGLMGLVRNEAGVVTYPDGGQFAVAVFTRRPPGAAADPARIDAGIGLVARELVGRLRGGRNG
ncbi:class A beta-lactamase-related serine hydrolase [Actinoplanes sp. Pm04-4]|uniref:Class A beta-lactamase-related serine hydrolase n=1 Tax=Paractinoplanes pyxinae TaxID=2997416 RepID=A0ABT4AYX1_9ACTN|nr:serine hydrolase [Actinoplanes pyxinae]MCY1138850.1 class A beta-lactamase-related serine hydrolase [Actinoplanes pyxinae]